jgi:hypothetical protein
MSSSDDQLAIVRQLRLMNERLEGEVERLRSSGGGDGRPPSDVVDAKIAASEARTDTKFAELRGDISRFATKGTAWGAMATAIGVVLTVAALAGDRFDAGMTVKDAVEATTSGQKARDAAQDQKLDEILSRLPGK